MDERNRPGPLTWLAGRSRWFWIVVALSLPALYVASFGPACWWFARGYVNRPGNYEEAYTHSAPRIYWPLGWLITYDRIHSPSVADALASPLGWYATLGTDIALLPSDFSPRPS